MLVKCYLDYKRYFWIESKRPKMSRKIGIWLDTRMAYVIYIKGEEAEIQEIISQVEDFHPTGGARSKTLWGPQDSLDEHKYLERKKHQLKSYFEEIIQKVQKGDDLYVFGPAEAKVGLQKVIAAQKQFPGNLLAVETADQMTENQKIKQVRTFFSQL